MFLNVSNYVAIIKTTKNMTIAYKLWYCAEMAKHSSIVQRAKKELG